jgi:receptor protein-tyrosine kinase
MEYVLDELTRAHPNRIVIFDSPPLLATSEAAVLADRMGQVVMVVAAESTQQQSVTAALEMLDSTKCINFVLNQLRTTVTDGEYYGGYYGGYEPYKSPAA